MVEHVGVALFCFDGKGAVTMMNAPARQLFRLAAPEQPAHVRPQSMRGCPTLLAAWPTASAHSSASRRGDEILQLVFYATEFELLDEQYKLVSFQNIRDELDRREIDSWQKLIRVLRTRS